MAKIGVIGAGSWGTALARLLCDNGHDVVLWSCIEAEIRMLKETHMQQEKLPGVLLPEALQYTTDLKEAMADKEIVVLAVPSPFTRSTARQMAAYYQPDQVIVSVAKGIEDETYFTLTDVIEDEIKGAVTCALSGPSHAEEVVRQMPTTVVAACPKKSVAERVQAVFMSPVFRVYTSPDMVGVELGGSLKNVIALAAGVVDGLGYGDNCKAALITRGIHELGQLGLKMGARFETLSGLSGIGDLIVTCTSVHSRNRMAGYYIGQGHSMKEAMEMVSQIVEGVYSTKAAYHLSQKYGVEMPIISEVNAVLFEDKNPRQAVEDLMLRDRKSEGDDSGWS
ncbi:MAG: NAD(P)H-dependent glycerol-3-phosphate dehydrogenase [Lachnospiraceae bacterium]|nr:NAD(P)H-dependent glycerol-3-phosphate dehydrogenase [Lachnospiraceae bacterium]